MAKAWTMTTSIRFNCNKRCRKCHRHKRTHHRIDRIIQTLCISTNTTIHFHRTQTTRFTCRIALFPCTSMIMGIMRAVSTATTERNKQTKKTLVEVTICLFSLFCLPFPVFVTSNHLHFELRKKWQTNKQTKKVVVWIVREIKNVIESFT